MPKRFTEVKTNEHLCGTWEDYISVDATQLGTQCNSVVAMYNGHGFIVCNMTPNRWREWPEWALEVELSGLYKSWEAEVFKDEKVTTWLVSAMENTDNDKLQRIIHDITGRQPSVFVYESRKMLSQSNGQGGTFCLSLRPGNPGEEIEDYHDCIGVTVHRRKQ